MALRPSQVLRLVRTACAARAVVEGGGTRGEEGGFEVGHRWVREDCGAMREVPWNGGWKGGGGPPFVTVAKGVFPCDDEIGRGSCPVGCGWFLCRRFGR